MEVASFLPPHPLWLMDTGGHLLKWQGCRPCDSDVENHTPCHGEWASRALRGQRLAAPRHPPQTERKAQQLLTSGGLGEKTLVPSPTLGAVHDIEGSLGTCWRMRSCLAFTQDPSRFSCIHSPSPSSHSPHEFLWSLLREGENLKVERRVGVELIRMGDSKLSKHRLLKGALFISQWPIALSGMFRKPPNKPLVRMILSSVFWYAG